MSVPTKAILMFKAPESGCVKTRLGKTVGSRNALEIYRWMGRRQLEAIPNDWNVETRYSPEGAEIMMRDWLGPSPVLKTQGTGDLGDRMLRAARSSFSERTKQKLVFLGADCLTVDEALLRKSEAALDNSDFVLGPASDGGYYLLGMRRLGSSLFENINWSSSSVLSETINRIRSMELSYQLLEEREDVDDWDTLVLQREHVDPDLWDQLCLNDFLS